MRRTIEALTLAMIAAVCSLPAVAAPTIYKCTGADGGTVFLPQPCGKNAKEIDTSRALQHGTAPNLQGVSDRAALATIDGRCANRERAINAQAARSMDEAGELGYSGYVGGENDIARATRENGIRAQYTAAADRKAAVARAQRIELDDLRKQCDKERADELKAQRDRDAKASTLDLPETAR